MKTIYKNAFKKAKFGMDRSHSLMLKNIRNADKWLLAHEVFSKHLRIANYVNKRLYKF